MKRSRLNSSLSALQLKSLKNKIGVKKSDVEKLKPLIQKIISTYSEMFKSKVELDEILMAALTGTSTFIITLYNMGTYQQGEQAALAAALSIPAASTFANERVSNIRDPMKRKLYLIGQAALFVKHIVMTTLRKGSNLTKENIETIGKEVDRTITFFSTLTNWKRYIKKGKLKRKLKGSGIFDKDFDMNTDWLNKTEGGSLLGTLIIVGSLVGSAMLSKYIYDDFHGNSYGLLSRLGWNAPNVGYTPEGAVYDKKMLNQTADLLGNKDENQRKLQEEQEKNIIKFAQTSKLLDPSPNLMQYLLNPQNSNAEKLDALREHAKNSMIELDTNDKEAFDKTMQELITSNFTKTVDTSSLPTASSSSSSSSSPSSTYQFTTESFKDAGKKVDSKLKAVIRKLDLSNIRNALTEKGNTVSLEELNKLDPSLNISSTTFDPSELWRVRNISTAIPDRYYTKRSAEENGAHKVIPIEPYDQYVQRTFGEAANKTRENLDKGNYSFYFDPHGDNVYAIRKDLLPKNIATNVGKFFPKNGVRDDFHLISPEWWQTEVLNDTIKESLKEIYDDEPIINEILRRRVEDQTGVKFNATDDGSNSFDTKSFTHTSSGTNSSGTNSSSTSGTNSTGSNGSSGSTSTNTKGADTETLKNVGILGGIAAAIIGNGNYFQQKMRWNIFSSLLRPVGNLIFSLLDATYGSLRRHVKKGWYTDKNPAHHNLASRVWHSLWPITDPIADNLAEWWNDPENKKRIEGAVTAIGGVADASMKDFLDYEMRESNYQDQLKNYFAANAGTVAKGEHANKQIQYLTNQANKKLRKENEDITAQWKEDSRVFLEKTLRERTLSKMEATWDTLKRQNAFLKREVDYSKMKTTDLLSMVNNFGQSLLSVIPSISKIDALAEGVPESLVNMVTPEMKQQANIDASALLRTAYGNKELARKELEKVAEDEERISQYTKATDWRGRDALPPDHQREYDRLVNDARERRQRAAQLLSDTKQELSQYNDYAKEEKARVTQERDNATQRMSLATGIGANILNGVTGSIQNLFNVGYTGEKQKIDNTTEMLARQLGLYNYVPPVTGAHPLLVTKFVPDDITDLRNDPRLNYVDYRLNTGAMPLRSIDHYATKNLDQAIKYDIPAKIARLEQEIDAEAKAKEAKKEKERAELMKEPDYSVLFPSLSPKSATTVQSVSAGNRGAITTNRPLRTNVLPLYQNGLKQSKIRNLPLQGVRGVYTPTSPLRIQTPIKYTPKAGKSGRRSKISIPLKKVRKLK